MTQRPVLLDLYCGAGGAAVGYHQAGFDVVGVDINPQPNYPYEFHQGDALMWLDTFDDPLHDFAAIHASPPCQAYSRTRTWTDRQHPDLLPATRDGLNATGKPWVIENVPGAPMRPDFKLCGCMFGLPNLRRVRLFETSWNGFALRPPCHHTTPTLSVVGHGGGADQAQRDAFIARTGRIPNLATARAAMGINWMTQAELSQAIPPAYTQWIGTQLREAL